MCGICGIIHDDPQNPVDRRVLETMNHTMLHRGPDDEGYFYGRGVGLAMRRLSIIDVEGGHQPFSSEDGGVYAMCNGEIYNFRELRRELERDAHTFKSRSDAEVLPHLYEDFGLDTPTKLNGMFGLAIWDEKNKQLLLARDRMGEKPLYWTHQRGIFIFASELKAILSHPHIESRIDRSSLAKYLALEYIPAPHTIIEGVRKLEPCHFLIFKNGKIIVRPYWDIPSGAENKRITEQEAAEEVARLLEISVKRRLISDVPLGVFLSGGIDSSSVVAMMVRHRDPREIKTFSIGFAEKSFDESPHARTVAKHFGTDHREQLFAPQDLIKLLPLLLSYIDEPIGDASIIPTYALSKFTRGHVTVALGGDGGDELFSGYPTFLAEKWSGLYRRIPRTLRKKIIEPIVDWLPVSDENMSLDFKLKQFVKGAGISNITRHFVWAGSFSPEEQRALLSYNPDDDVFGDVIRANCAAQFASLGNRLLYVYEKLYLAGDILTKVDRASMGASLEVRAPFLDHELVEFVSRLPYQMKCSGLSLKHILKKAMAPYLPAKIIARPKKGFGIPVAKWIKGPLKEQVGDMLSAEKIRNEGLFRPSEISRLVKDHMTGRVDNRKKLWTLLMFEHWLERWGQ